jgi:hypothetical protein
MQGKKQQEIRSSKLCSSVCLLVVSNCRVKLVCTTYMPSSLTQSFFHYLRDSFKKAHLREILLQMLSVITLPICEHPMHPVHLDQLIPSQSLLPQNNWEGRKFASGLAVNGGFEMSREKPLHYIYKIISSLVERK